MKFSLIGTSTVWDNLFLNLIQITLNELISDVIWINEAIVLIGTSTNRENLINSQVGRA